jgi:hypothetical protein
LALLCTDDDQESIQVPILLEDLKKHAPVFCEQNGIAHFLFMDVDRSATHMGMEE